jgi:hypothetical protein
MNPTWDWVNRGETTDDNEVVDDTLIDSWPIENGTTTGAVIITDGVLSCGQQIVAPYNATLISAKFALGKTGAPTGDFVAELYETASGIPAAGDGPIATSDPVNVDTFVVSPETALVEFVFQNGNIFAGRTYAICVTRKGWADGANHTRILQTQGATQAHPGRTVRCMSYDETWNEVIADTVFYLHGTETAPTPPDPTLEDSWPIENKNDDGSYGLYGRKVGISMSFTARRGGVLDRAKVWMKRSEPPQDGSVPITAHIYDTSMPIGTAKPEGVALATSEPVDSLTLAPMGGDPVCEPVEFTFVGANKIQFVKDKIYCLVLHRPSPLPATVWDAYRTGFDSSYQPPKAEGHYCDQNEDGVWQAGYQYFDLIFYIYSDA